MKRDRAGEHRHQRLAGTVMIGLGGERFAAGQVADTISAVNMMELGAGDVIDFSNLVEMPGSTYPLLAVETHLSALSVADRHAQRHAIRAELRFASAPPQISSYDIREFVH